MRADYEAWIEDKAQGETGGGLIPKARYDAPRLPAGRAPGLDAKGRGTWDLTAAVRWDPFVGFEVKP